MSASINVAASNAVSHGDNKGKVEVVVHWRPDPSPRYLIQVDHFGFHNNETFDMRYAIADQFWDSKSGPIFLYTGNEFFMESFIENTVMTVLN
ncbi:hypothetical protein HPB51_004448 [Rhipicephalus microplus]|uniref:Uncharacterized protein n=1 Tax=Rhipicephalus microplus TaxID=6941 RepID=A0A9J6ELT7_RHIMP|nr:hypothetical protein HPB51_004448 [Rhipicephalus microplus]